LSLLCFHLSDFSSFTSHCSFLCCFGTSIFSAL
jgi:hypothetical protein